MSGEQLPVDGASSRCRLFSDLSERRLNELAEQGALRNNHLDEGDCLLVRVRPDKEESLVLLEGTVDIKVDGQGGDWPGADGGRCRALPLTGSSVEICARSPARLCRFVQDELDYMISWSVMLSDLPSEDRRVRSQLQMLRCPGIFKNLPFSNVVETFKRMVPRTVRAGEEFIRQGEPGDYFYVLESGRAEVWRQDIYDDEPRLVGLCIPGDHVGDEALVSGGTRNATVRMVEDGNLLALAKEDFRELISQPMVHEVEVSVARALAESGHRFLDVRYEEEWEDGHIPGATLMPLPDIRDLMSELSPSERYITYCLSGKRSAVAAMILKSNGYQVACMKDGLREWPDPTVTD